MARNASAFQMPVVLTAGRPGTASPQEPAPGGRLDARDAPVAEDPTMRGTRMAVLAGLITLAGAGGALAQSGPAKDPTANGGNAVINNGAGSGTGTTSPGPGMTLQDGKNATPTANPIADGGNSQLNDGRGSGTGTKEPKGDK
jgi:hypothetical protein